jgi:hypothetical protein
MVDPGPVTNAHLDGLLEENLFLTMGFCCSK